MHVFGNALPEISRSAGTGRKLCFGYPKQFLCFHQFFNTVKSCRKAYRVIFLRA